jgi:hypothetical protein
MNARPAWITPGWIERVRGTLQPYYPSPLSDHDALEILLTMDQVFRLLKGEKENAHEERQDSSH